MTNYWDYAAERYGYPVLDDDCAMGMVIGWARTRDAAAKLLSEALDTPVDVDDMVRASPDAVSFSRHPDINTSNEIEAVEHIGAWVRR